MLTREDLEGIAGVEVDHGLTVRVERLCGAESRDGSLTALFNPGTTGQYKGHVPIGNVVLLILGQEWIVPQVATDLAEAADGLAE
jgi:hypothetical protein